MDLLSLKEQKEAFVAGHGGTSIPEELLLVTVLPPVIGWWCWHRWKLVWGRRDRGWATVVLSLVEALCFPVPAILCQSEWLYPWGLLHLFVALPTIAIVGSWLGTGGAAERTTKRAEEGATLSSEHPSNRSTNDGTVTGPDTGTTLTTIAEPPNKAAALTVYRASLLWMTIVAILAVDFPFFPRKLAKTEVRGYGLMDLGAASFVISGGFVSPRSRGKTTSSALAAPGRLCRQLLIPIALGCVRLVTHKTIEYQEHDSEYGTHWNFFFTLAVVHSVRNALPGPSLTCPIALFVGMQLLLDFAGLQHWIETAPRVCARSHHTLCNLVVSNREGLWGCLGYAGLYWLAEGLAYRFYWTTTIRQQPQRPLVTAAVPSPPRPWIVAANLLFLWKAVDVWHPQSTVVSRRTTNLWFALWALTVNWTALAALDFLARHMATSATTTSPQRLPYVPPGLSAMNRHGLPLFVAANLLTGLVNLSTDTLKASHFQAFQILLGYVAAVGVLAVLFDLIAIIYYNSKDSKSI